MNLNAADLKIIGEIRKRPSSFQRTAVILVLLLLGVLAGEATWKVGLALRAPLPHHDQILFLQESNRRYRDLLVALGGCIGWLVTAALCVGICIKNRSSRDRDALLLKLADERERDLELPR